MANNFKRFKEGIQIAPVLAADPLEGKVGEIYCNATTGMLRVCVSVSPLVWQDLAIGAGTTDFATLAWDDTEKRWKENDQLLIDGSFVFLPDTAVGLDLTLRAGNALDLGETGGDLYLLVGEGDADSGEILTNSSMIRGVSRSVGVDFTVKAGDALDPLEKGSKLVLESGDGGAGGDRGDLTVVAHRMDLLLDDAFNLGVKAADPAAALDGDTYYNAFWDKFRYYDGSDWRFTNQKGLNPVDLFDVSYTILPPDDTSLIDGQTVLTGMVVVFTHLSTDPGYYHATVDMVGDITWTKIALAQSADASFTLGDKIIVKYGDQYRYAELLFNGAGWLSPFTLGSEQDSILIWDSVSKSWVENADIRISSFAIYMPDNEEDDASSASSLIMTAANKTDGTGDGGSLTVRAGSSVGGNGGSLHLQAGDSSGGEQGDVKIQGNIIELQAQHSSNPLGGEAAQLYFHSLEQRFKYHDGSDWYSIEGPRGLAVARAKDDVLTVLPDKRGPDLATASLSATTATITTLAAHGLQLGESIEVGDVDIDDWAIGTTYNTDDIIEYNGVVYQSLVDNNLGNQPDESPADWDAISNPFHGIYFVSAVNSATEFEYTTTVSGSAAGTGGFAARPSIVIGGDNLSDGDIALFTNLVSGNNQFYRASFADNTITWEVLAYGLSADGTPTHGDGARIQMGTHSNTTWFFNVSGWVSKDIPDGTLTHSLLHWTGSGWAAENTVQIDSYTIWGKDDGDDDANPAADLTITASEKLAGTGDGGNLVLKGGGSLGGDQGHVIVEGDRFRIDCEKASDPELLESNEREIYYNTSIQKFKYFDGMEWRPIGSEMPTTIPFTDGETGVLLTQTIVADFNMLQIDFSIRRGSALERGTLWVASDGSDATISATGTGWGDPEITFLADIDGGNLRVRFDSAASGDAGSIMFVVRDKWLHT